MVQVSMRMALSSKPSMMRISTAAGSGVLKDQEVVGSLSFGRLSYENADRTWAVLVRFSVLLVFSRAMEYIERKMKGR